MVLSAHFRSSRSREMAPHSSFLQQSTTRAIDWGEVMAASTLVAIPVIIFFVLVQGKMTSGLVSGAVKG